MNVLIVGSGGREHALAWTCAKSANVERVLVAPGNAGTASEAKCTNVDIAVSDFEGLCELARRERVELTIVGPEEPLVNGIREHFNSEDLACFAPTSKAAQLEGSKSFAKSFMHRHGIPTADFFLTDSIEEATEHISQSSMPIVVKANGLAAGKGVVVAHSQNQAIEAASRMLTGERFGDAGREVVLEEFLAGEEASYIVMSDGVEVLPFASSQDHKPVFDGDQGPNTGGMGAYSPAPVVTPDIEAKILEQVIRPTIRGMAEEGNPFQGFLYAGLMIRPDNQVNVVEFNCRFGDPEAQPVLSRLQSDLPSLCMAALNRDLVGKSLEFDDKHAVGIVMASDGYPESYETGRPITGLDLVSPNCKTFHAGTKSSGDQIETAGGRVLCVVGSNPDFRQARECAYRGIEAITWEGCHFRTDIGNRALTRISS